MKKSGRKSSIILSSFNNLSSLKLSLISLEYVKKISDYDLEIIISDDGSTDGTIDFLKQKGVKFCTQDNDGYRLAKVWNNGAKIARDESTRFIFGNSDIIFPRLCIERHLHKRYKNVLLAGLYPSIKEDCVPDMTEQCLHNHMINDFAGPIKGFTCDRRRDFIEGKKKPILNHMQKIPPRFMYGGNWSTPRHVFEKLEGLDENFKGWGGEDFDYAKRAEQISVSVYIDFYCVGYHLDHPTTNRDNTKHIGKGYFKKKWNL